MSKYTPWAASDPDSCNEVIDAKGRTIAVVEEWNNENRENVTLLASAPDLLEALELVTMELIQMHSCYQPKCEGGCPSVSYVEQAQAAIKKSKGE
jgi:hypothetical protein